MAGIAAKVLDRFRPGIFDRLKQSKEAKAQRRNVAAPKLVAADIETQPRRILDTQTSIFGNQGELHTQQVWNGWNTWNNQIITITAPTYATTTQIWETWQDTDPYAGRGPRRALDPAEAARRQAEEQKWRAEETARNARWHEEERVRRRKTDEAEATAMKLLVSMLSDQQRSDLQTHKHFFVDAPSGRLYRIDYGTHGNVKVVDRNTRKIIERLCIQPNGVPAGDANLMQKLLIETAEDLFRSHANITLEDGRMIYGKTENLTGDKLAEVIPIRRAA